MNTKKTNRFSENLEQLIRKNKIKQIDLAQHLGLSKSAISNYISGVSMPKFDTIAKIACFFGVSFEQLIDSDFEYSPVNFEENGTFVCVIPLFHDTLVSEKIIYRNDNFIGNITAPIFLPETAEYYALSIKDDLTAEFGISKGSIVVFDSNEQPQNEDLAVVLIRSQRKLVVRKIFFGDKFINISSAVSGEKYNITKNNCDVAVLGKVIFATFDPNKKL